MFILTTMVDTVRIPANMLSLPTLVALHSEIDHRFPNRVLMDVGLVICRYGDCLKVTNGSCVPGDGGSHHECIFRMIVFRPFVEEVCVGKIVKSTADGIHVSVGFFQDIFIPAYWMLRPSHYEEKIGLWVWTPNYNEDEEADDDEGDGEGVDGDPQVKSDPVEENPAGNDEGENDGDEANEDTKGEEDDRFEMEIGAEIRFKVKSIQFTQVTNTAKGLQATTTTTAHSHSIPKEQEEKTDKSLRKRSLSMDLGAGSAVPATMHIVASICEDGLGLTSWWTSGEDDEEEEEQEGEEGAEDVENGAEQEAEEYGDEAIVGEMV